MTYKLPIYKQQDPILGTVAAWVRYLDLKEKHLVFDDAIEVINGVVLYNAWLEFESESEAAIWLLTYL